MAGYQYTIPTTVTFSKGDGAEGEHMLYANFTWVSPATGKTHTHSPSVMFYPNGELFQFYKDAIGVMEDVPRIKREVATLMAIVLRQEIGVQSDFETAKGKFEDKLATTSYTFDIYVDLAQDFQTGSKL